MFYNCTPLFFLSSIACKLAECLSQEELEILSADLNTLGEMLESLLARQPASQDADSSQTECASSATE